MKIAQNTNKSCFIFYYVTTTQEVPHHFQTANKSFNDVLSLMKRENSFITKQLSTKGR